MRERNHWLDTRAKDANEYRKMNFGESKSLRRRKRKDLFRTTNEKKKTNEEMMKHTSNGEQQWIKKKKTTRMARTKCDNQHDEWPTNNSEIIAMDRSITLHDETVMHNNGIQSSSNDKRRNTKPQFSIPSFDAWWLDMILRRACISTSRFPRFVFFICAAMSIK